MSNPNVSEEVMKSEVKNSENSEKSNSEEAKCDEGKLRKMSFDIKSEGAICFKSGSKQF